MAPSTGEKSLDDILVSDLVKKSSSPGLKHKLVQLSLYSYLEKVQKINWVELEYPLKYVGQKHLYKSHRKRHHRKIYKEQNRNAYNYKEKVSEWPVDMALIYNDGNKKVCELIEVETINISEFWERITSMRLKVKKIEAISQSKHLNLILENVDEIRFSLALNANGLEEADMERLLEEFKRKFGGIERKNGVRAYNIYALKGNLYRYCPQGFNTRMLEALGNVYFKGNKWRQPFRELMASTYMNLRKEGLHELENLYATRPLKVQI